MTPDVKYEVALCQEFLYEKMEKSMNEMNPTIKLLICYHKQAPLFKDNILTPIHVGRALANKRLSPESEEYKWLNDNMIGDDTGDNISEKNGSYNEMTALYWAWKNYEELGNPDYIGMMHYRRHFVYQEGEMGEKRFEEFDKDTYYEQIRYSESKLQEFVKDCDYITHLGRVDNVYKHYCDSHKQEDLDKALSIIKKLHPEYTATIKKYVSGSISNFCNMFILKKELFFKYCEFVFSVLEEFEKQVDISEKRLFISERITGVFFAHLMEDKTLKYKVVPISFIDEPSTTNILLQKTEESTYPLAVTLNSIIRKKKDKSKYNITVVSDVELDDCEVGALRRIVKYAQNTSLEFSLIRDDENIICCALRVYQDEKKCLIISDGSLVLNDLADFFSTVSVDDYYVAGIPVQTDNITTSVKVVSHEVLVLNLAKIRSKKIREVNTEFTGYLPDYYVSSVGEESDYNSIFDSRRSRVAIINASSWKRILLFDDYRPWEEPQKPLSIYWWEEAKRLPVMLPFPAVYGEDFIKLLNEQQKEANEWKVGIRKSAPVSRKALPANNLRKEIQNPIEEDWRSYSMLGKLKFYYKHNGFKQTIVYCFNKYVRRRPAA